MASKGHKGSAGSAEMNEESPGELDFEKGDNRGGRAGDVRSSQDYADEFPDERVRQAGRTAGENPDGEVTADDLAPETLLDEDRSRTPAAQEKRVFADSLLRDAGEAEIGEGHGRDEAELAQSDAEKAAKDGGL